MGGWCFDRLKEELVAMGHDAVAPDLPGHGDRSNEVATLKGYGDAVTEQLQHGDVLVGYSMGGWVAPLAADRRPHDVRHIVYLAAAVHQEGGTMEQSMAALTSADQDRSGSESYLDLVRFSADGNFMLLPEYDAYRAVIGPDLTDADAHYIYDRMRPQSMVPQREAIRTPSFWNSDIPRSYIGYASDNCVPSVIGQRSAEVLGVKGKWLEGSHFGVWSQAKRTAEEIAKLVDER